MVDIERSILVSILEHQFVNSSEEILHVSLNDTYFSHPTHKLLIKAINRLKELDEPIDTDYVRAKLIDSKVWTTAMDSDLLNIMVHNPIGTFYQFNHYYNLLSKETHITAVKNKADGL